MQLPREAIPLFIALASSRDRAAHEGKTVGNVSARANVSLTLGGVFDSVPTEQQQDTIAVLQSQACAIIRHTLQTLANDISRTLADSTTPASLVFNPDFNVFLTHVDEPAIKDMQQRFAETMRADVEAAEAMQSVTAKIVRNWQG